MDKAVKEKFFEWKFRGAPKEPYNEAKHNADKVQCNLDTVLLDTVLILLKR